MYRIHFLLTVLEKTLGRAIVLPERKLTSVEEFFEKFPEVRDVFLDGGERRIERPKKSTPEHRAYSGKKKAHTRKNVVVVDEKKHILGCRPLRWGDDMINVLRTSSRLSRTYPSTWVSLPTPAFRAFSIYTQTQSYRNVVAKTYPLLKKNAPTIT